MNYARPVTSEPLDLDGRKAPTRAPIRAQTMGWLVGVLLLGGIALRLALGFESFWLDEAWSHALARDAGSVLEIFETRHDNNHLLNTLYLYAVEDLVGNRHWVWYRIPALLAGCAALFALWGLASRWSRSEALLVLALAASSFPLASASAQARGYSLAILCSILYAALSFKKPAGRDWPIALGLAGTAAVGLLSHASFVYTWLAVIAAGLTRDDPRDLLTRHALPLFFLAALYGFFYAGVEVGGGPRYERFVTIRQAISQTMALPRRGPLTWLATGVAGLVLLRGLVLFARRNDPRGVFFAVALVVAPGLVIAVANPQLLYARYLLLLFPWFYWLVAIVLAEELGQGGTRRLAAGIAMTLLVGSNLWHAGTVLAEGRNDYVRTLAFIDESTEGKSIEIGSDHDFRNPTVLRFYAERVPSGRPIRYLKKAQWPARGPEWYLRHDWKAGHDPEAIFSPARGLSYERVASFEHGAGDGFQWFVYRRVKPPASPDAASSAR